MTERPGRPPVSRVRFLRREKNHQKDARDARVTAALARRVPRPRPLSPRRRERSGRDRPLSRPRHRERSGRDRGRRRRRPSRPRPSRRRPSRRRPAGLPSLRRPPGPCSRPSRARSGRRRARACPRDRPRGSRSRRRRRRRRRFPPRGAVSRRPGRRRRDRPPPGRRAGASPRPGRAPRRPGRAPGRARGSLLSREKVTRSRAREILLEGVTRRAAPRRFCDRRRFGRLGRFCRRRFFCRRPTRGFFRRRRRRPSPRSLRPFVPSPSSG